MSGTGPAVVVVTGGASGMGAATSRLFAAGGSSVVVVDCDADGAEAMATEIDGEAKIGDVSDPGFCEETVDGVVSDYGRLDVLVNAAGVIQRGGAAETDDEAWRRTIAVNAGGVFFMSRAAVRHMAERGSGAIVNFGSISGDVGAGGGVAYCASKGAVHQITRAMAMDHATDGIRINAVAPGEVNTPMFSSGRSSPPTPEELEAVADAFVPMKRLGDPEEIARVVVFLASDAASYMTGAIVPVDAGYTSR